jgi:ATP-binding cassette subfamily B protein
MIIAAYVSYIEGAFRPMAGVTLYHKLYRMLYKKAGSVELRCYEDSSFYNKYALAIDRADESLFMIVRNLFGIVFGAIAAITVFTTMYTIDNIAVLFIFFPIIGNFVFGYIYNRMLYKREQALVPYRRRIDYVNRVMHLADFSKEMRLSNVYNLMKYKYMKALDGIFDTVEK